MKKIFLFLLMVFWFTFSNFTFSYDLNYWCNFDNDPLKIFNTINKKYWIDKYLNTKKYKSVFELSNYIDKLIKKKMDDFYKKHPNSSIGEFSCLIHLKIIKWIKKLEKNLNNNNRFIIFVLNYLDYKVKLADFERTLSTLLK